ncbi:MAG: rRNA maturation RNase YbeY [Alphaproteobacteria bacterium]|jgi:probable rRNA maturation factor|nr:rRNA maturation RNase YbeY [Alphaproteobacteria bacterium]
MPTHHTFRLLHRRRVHGQAQLTCAVKVPTQLPAWVRQAVAAAWPAIPAFTATSWQLSIKVSGAAAAAAANQQFRGKDYTPDVLSFPLWDDGYAGDILLCWPKLQADAAAQGKPLPAHVQHLVVHALLHLAGEDHLTPAQARRMEAQEIAILHRLGWPNPYLIG